MFRKAICGMIVAFLGTSAARADVLTVQDTTAAGDNDTLVRDNYLRFDAAENTNGGRAAGDVRMYPDTGFPTGKGPRHLQLWFNVSSIPSGSIVSSVTFGTHWIRNGASAPAITGFKLSRFNSGKDWIEGIHVTDTVSAGEPTWNSQKHDHNPAWATPGATGATDIDLATTITWDKTAAATETVTRSEPALVAWVQDWVNNPANNNGILMWGGTGPGGANNYHTIVTSEDADTANRPYLSITWAPSGSCEATVAPTAVQTGAGYEGGAAITDVLHSKGTANGGGNQYWYPDFFQPSFTIVSGDHLVYDIYTKNASGSSGGVDLEGGIGSLRDSGILDQNGRGAHPNTDLSAVALNTWYHRDFDLTSKAGTTITAFEMGHELDNGDSEFYIRNVRIMNGSSVRLDAFPSNWSLPGGADIGPGNNGYSPTLGPQKDQDPDPAAIKTITYTIANIGSTSFNWTVTEVLSDGVTPNDYSWLTLSPASGTGLAGGASASVSATLSSNTTAAGQYTGYLRFSNNCSPPLAEIREIDFTVIGCAIAVQERRIRYLGPCNSTATTTETFTIKNNGAHNWTGYNAVEDAEDDDWMTVSYTSSPVVQFATGTVTATIDWSQVPAPGNQKSKIKFGASCDSGSTFVYDTPVGTGAQAGDETVNVVDTTPAAVKLIYKGDQNPSNNNSAGIGYKFFLWSGIDQGTIVTESGVGPDKASDGLAYYLNDTSSAKTKWQSVKNDDTPAYTINRYVGSTAMSRLKVTSTSGTNLQYDFGIQHQASISAYCYWGGAANLIMDTRGNSATVSGDANYHVIRVTSRDTNVTGQGIVVNYYLDENPSPVLTITNASGSADGTVDGIAFGAASTAQSKETYFDWISGTNAGAFAPGDEVACIGSLVPGSNCNLPKVDIDGDGDVDMDDFGELQKCYTGDKITFNGGIGFSLSQECACLDNDHDQDIDAGDFNHFVNCETGASIPWVSSGPCPN